MDRQASFVSTFCLATLVATNHASTATINVPADQPTIQAGINAAVNGDTVLVAPGTYNESIRFNGKAITVQSSGGRDVTTITAAGLASSVVKFMDGESSQSVLHGFTITGGWGTAPPPPFASNARHGGGIYVANSPTSSATIISCRIKNNLAVGVGVGGPGRGGGMYQGSGVLTMIDTSFIQNTAASGTAVSADSGGLYLGGQSALLLNCEFVGNIVQGGWSSGFPPTGSGGGMYVTNNALLAINCSFRANQVSGNNNAESGYGGGAYDTRNSVYVNCEFTGNSATFSGGGVYASSFSGSTPTLINCTITRNVSQTFTAGGVGSGSPSNQPALLNCIVFDNEGVEIDSSAVVNHSCVEGGYPGPGNIDADPLFVDAAHGDFHLQDASPCRDAGNRLLLPADAQDLDGDANTTETLSRDLDLVRRIVNGQVDMGAYEWQRTCLTDISRSSPGMAGDGFTNIGDLLAVIAGWGPCDQCNADVNNDDVVNITDLLAVIAGWGACP